MEDYNLIRNAIHLKV